MKQWKRFINAIWQVDEPIGTRDAIKISLVVVTLSLLVLATLLGYQPTSVVF